MNYRLRPAQAETALTAASLLCCVLLLLFSPHSAGIAPIAVTETGLLDHALRADDLEVYRGEGAKPATIAEIEQLWQAGAFEPVTTLNFGLQQRGIWGRMVVENQQSSHRALVLNHRFAPIDLMEIYFRGPDGEWIHQRAGDTIINSAVNASRTATFLLNLPPGEAVPVYMRIATSSNLNFEMRLQYPSVYNQSELRLAISYGTLFGAALVSAFYLALWGVMAQNIRATTLSGYLLCYALFLALLLGFARLVMPDLLVPWINHLHVLSLALMAHMSARFFRNFFQLAHYLPRADRLVQALQWLSLALALTHLVPLWAAAALNATVLLIGPVITITIALQLWYRKIPQAGFFTLGWLFAQGALMAASLRVVGFLPDVNWVLHLPALGLVLAMGFFSAALLKRFSEERELVFKDHLTGLLNRRGLEVSSASELERAQRFGLPLSLLALDVDHFKRVNDTHGHDTGDLVLKALAECLTSNCRELDLVARVGGEEFVILCVQTDLREAHRLAERIRESVAGLQVAGVTLTISIGATAIEATDKTVWDALLRADRLLYQAKHQGRNRTVSA
ncbi:MAG: diguanylate cyclase [Haliea sp.]